MSDDKSESNNTNNNNIVSFRPCIDIHLGKVKQIVGFVEICVVYIEENVAVLSLFPISKSSFSHRGTRKEYS